MQSEGLKPHVRHYISGKTSPFSRFENHWDLPEEEPETVLLNGIHTFVFTLSHRDSRLKTARGSC